MKPISVILTLAAALGLSACASVDTATRNAALAPPQVEPLAAAPAPLPVAETRPAANAALDVMRINVRVPRSLKVSEANTYRPIADIVWREDPLGDRYAQVAAIFQTAMEQGVQGFAPGRDVALDIQVTRFHAVTEKTRYTIGGVHDIHFFVTVLDAATGAPLTQPWLVETELKAYGGARAMEAMSRGETQKVRITAHLAQVIRTELSRIAPAPVAPLTGAGYSSKGL